MARHSVASATERDSPAMAGGDRQLTWPQAGRGGVGPAGLGAALGAVCGLAPRGRLAAAAASQVARCRAG